MPLPGLHLLAVLGVFAAAAKKSSGGSSFFLIFLIVIAGAYMLFIAPKRRKQRAELNQQRSFEVGDEVVTTGGIFGRVESSEGDRVALDISDGIIVEVARTAIARRVDPVAATTPAEDADEHDETDATETAAAHDWEPPTADEPAAAGGTSLNGAATNGSGGAHGEWADPWAAPPADGERGAAGAGESA